MGLGLGLGLVLGGDSLLEVVAVRRRCHGHTAEHDLVRGRGRGRGRL